MDPIPSLILFLESQAIMSLLGWDTLQNRKKITRLIKQQSNSPKTYEQQCPIITLFNRS